MSNTVMAKDKLAADFAKVMEDIDSLVGATVSKSESEATALRERIRDRLDAAGERMANVQQAAVSRAKEAAHATDSYVHEHPWQSIGAAAALGLALGVLIGRR